MSISLLLLLASHSFGFGFGLGSTTAKRSLAVIEKARASTSTTTTQGHSSSSGPSSRVRWAYSTAGLYYSGVALDSSDNVYFASSHHFVYYNGYWNQGQKPPSATYGLYKFTGAGSLVWFYTDGGDVPARGSPVVASDGTVYVVMERLTTTQFGTREELHAVKPDGTLKWKVEISSAYSQIGAVTPALAADGTIYVAGNRDFQAYNPDGTRKWIVYGSPSGTSVWYGTPAVAPDGTVYAVLWDGGGQVQALRAFNPDGTLKWASEHLGTYPITGSPSIGPDGTIYLGIHDQSGPFGNNKGVLAAYDPSDGSRKWFYDTGDFDVRSQAVVDADGTIYFGTKGNSGWVTALNPDGTLKWRRDSYQDANCNCGVDVYGSPVIGADGKIYAATEFGYFYSFDANGTLLYKDEFYSNTGGFGWGGAAISAGGTIYATKMYGMLVAINSTSLGVKAAASWPKYGYSRDNQGRKP